MALNLMLVSSNYRRIEKKTVAEPKEITQQTALSYYIPLNFHNNPPYQLQKFNWIVDKKYSNYNLMLELMEMQCYLLSIYLFA